MEKKSKYYQYRIVKIPITPALKKEMFSKKRSYRELQDIAKACEKSYEYMRIIFNDPPEMLNKKIVDAIRMCLGLDPLPEPESEIMKNFKSAQEKLNNLVKNERPASKSTTVESRPSNKKSAYMSPAMRKRLTGK